MRKTIFLIAVIAPFGFASVAAAGSLGRPCTTVSQDKWLSIEALTTKVEAQGYTVRDAKLKKACGEIYVVDKNGGRAELFLDPTNGEIVGKL